MTIPAGQDSETREHGARHGRPSLLLTDEALAILVHELRSLLAAIQMRLQAIKLASDPVPVIEQPIGVMERQTRHLARLIEDLLDLTRARAGKLELREEWLDLGRRSPMPRRRVARSWSRTVMSSASARRRNRSSCGRTARPQQNLVNLLTNAAKYNANWGRRVPG